MNFTSSASDILVKERRSAAWQIKVRVSKRTQVKHRTCRQSSVGLTISCNCFMVDDDGSLSNLVINSIYGHTGAVARHEQVLDSDVLFLHMLYSLTLSGVSATEQHQVLTN